MASATELFRTLLTAFWENLALMAPYLLFGFAMAGLLSVVVPTALVERHLAGKGFLPPLKAALLSLPLPLCSCGVIPVAASLRRQGAGKGATSAFLVVTPQTGADNILATYSLLGPLFAVFTPVATFLSGLAGGWAVTLADRDPASAPPLTKPAGRENGNVLTRALRHGFVTLPADVGKTLLVGLILAGFISAVIPENFFERFPGGGGGIGTMLLTMLAGIPMYVCATASIPIAAALVAKGLSPGAALVFLITGPVTNGAAFAAIFRLLGRRAGLVHLASIAVSALAMGVLIDHLFPAGLIAAQVRDRSPACHVESGGEWLSVAWAVGLLVVLALAMRPAGRPGRAAKAGPGRTPPGGAPLDEAPGVGAGEALGEGVTTVHWRVHGMTCAHCTAGVKAALSTCLGVRAVAVDLAGRRVSVTGRDLDPVALEEALRQAGFPAERTGPDPGGPSP
ncbi:MAG: permease [Acidobacteria bacterium]|nr:permease [Acidobacteriota bacterium]